MEPRQQLSSASCGFVDDDSRRAPCPGVSASSGEISTTPACDDVNSGAYFAAPRKLRSRGDARSSGATPLTTIDASPTSSAAHYLRNSRGGENEIALTAGAAAGTPPDHASAVTRRRFGRVTPAGAGRRAGFVAGAAGALGLAPA